VYRSKQTIRRIGVLAVYVLAGTTAGAIAGAGAGALGALLSEDARVIGATVGSLALALLGLAAITGRLARPPLQCDRETPQRWARGGGGIRWGLLNGSSLGFGATSRLGFVLWYVIPMGAFLSGSAVFGAALWGLYGFVRMAGAGAIWVAMERLAGFDALWLTARKGRAYELTAAASVTLGTGTFAWVGL
jgi:hypothetical protein